MISALIAAFLLAYCGMLGLCVGLERHFKQLWKRAPTVLVRRLLRTAGWLALVASFTVSVQIWGGAIGPVVWFGLLSLAGLALVLLLPYAERGALWIAGLGWPLLGMLSIF